MAQTATKPKEPKETEQPEPALEGVGAPTVEQLLAIVLQQQSDAQEERKMLRELLTQQAQEISDRERAAAEAAASRKLPPAAGDKEDGFEPVVFRSKGTEFRVIRVGRHKWTAPNGEAQVTDGRDYQFVSQGIGASELRVFNSNVAEFLRGRPSYNREFWEVGREPHAPPDPELVFDRIMEAVVDYDDARLEELAKLEQASHKRPVVLKAIRQARQKIRGRVEG